MCVVDKDIISFPIFLQQMKNKHKKRTKTDTLVSLEALRRAAWNILTMGCIYIFLDLFFGGVSLIGPCLEDLQCALQVCCGKK